MHKCNNATNDAILIPINVFAEPLDHWRGALRHPT